MLIFADSFDHLSDSQILQKYDDRAGSITISGAAGRNSTAGLTNTSGGIAGTYLKKSIAAVSPSTLFAGFALQVPTLPAVEKKLCCFLEAGASHVEVQLVSDGRVRAYRNGTLLGTSTGAIAATQVGLNANLIYTNAGSAYTGQSGVELDTSAIAADASNPLTILRVADVPGRNEVGSSWTVVEVRLNQHTEVPGAIGV